MLARGRRRDTPSEESAGEVDGGAFVAGSEAAAVEGKRGWLARGGLGRARRRAGRTERRGNETVAPRGVKQGRMVVGSGRRGGWMELRRGKQRWEWLPASGRPAAAVSPPESPGARSGTSPIPPVSLIISLTNNVIINFLFL